VSHGVRRAAGFALRRMAKSVDENGTPAIDAKLDP
jgi:hypothetical protein